VVLLSPQRGQIIDPVTEADLDRVFAEQKFGEFLLLHVSDRDCIEGGQYPGADGYRIQWCSPAREKMYATRELLSLSQVHQAFVGYLLGRDWHSGFDWVPWEPEKVRIPCQPDYGRFPFAGELDDGTLFMAFVTGERAEGEGRRWVAVLHLFDPDGNHLRSEAKIGGYDGIGIDVACERADAELGRLVVPILPRVKRVGDVFIRPFEVVLNGVLHGLVYEDTCAAAVFEPRDVWFYFPWDTGRYDT
jgi:hypothetical protein